MYPCHNSVHTSFARHNSWRSLVPSYLAEPAAEEARGWTNHIGCATGIADASRVPSTRSQPSCSVSAADSILLFQYTA